MKPLTIRASLIAWFVGLTMLLLAAFSATLYFSVSRALRSGLDARLETAATGFAALCDFDEDARAVEFELSEQLAAQLAGAFPGRSLEVWFWYGRRLMHRSGARLDVPLPPEDWDAGHDLKKEPLVEFSTIEEPSGPRRLISVLARSPSVPADMLTGESAKPAYTVLVRVAESLAPVEAQLATIGWFVVILGCVSAGVVVLFGILLSRRVVRPLRELGEAAAAVRAGSAVRLPRRGAGDEVDGLADHLENAFGRLDDALQRQTRFTSDAAHELRNPISVIRNAAEIALRRERPQQEYRTFLEDVHETSKRMSGVVEALLLLARIDAGTAAASFRKVDLAAIARDSAGVQPDEDGRVRVRAGAPAFVRGDAALLKVLVDNLLSNALRYSNSGSEVTVTVEAEDGVVLSVRDRGPGIPAGDVERVFERFYRAEPSNPGAPGAGLGLAIVAEVARIHSAKSSIDTSEAGTTVSVVFPASSGD